jgi:transcriptional regulator with GAF, ATPase, and Fis domain
VPVNCTALSESLLESELFGHARGAFTGAIAAKRGLFETANGGTLFLDEIGDMGPKMQAQILRVLQDGEMRPVGGTEAIRVDVRLVCATNRDLEAEVKAARFREDLYFRINVVTVRMPPLRDRAGDIPILVRHFINKIARRESRALASVSPETLEVLCRYGWPGNVRELENAIERAVAVAKGNVVLPSDLPAEVYGGASIAPASIIDDRPTLGELERRYIALVLAECGGNKKRAAEKLGIDRRTLYRAIERSGDATDPEEDAEG